MTATADPTSPRRLRRKTAPPAKEEQHQHRRHRSPTVIQMEAVECGAACLAMVLAFYKRFVPLEELRSICGVSRDGSNAANLLRAARSFGLVAKGFQMDAPALRKLRTPAVIFWAFQHFMVLEGIKTSWWGRRGARYYVNDPGSGPRTINAQEFDASYAGIVLTFEPGPNFRPGGRPVRVWDGLRQRASRTRGAILLVLLASLLLVIPGLAAPAFSRVFIDRVLGTEDHSILLPLVAAMALAALATVALTAMQQTYLLRVETKVALLSAARFFRHLLRLPVDFLNQRQPAEVGNRVASNDVVAEILSRDLANTLLNLILVAFYAFLMVRYDVLLSVIGFAFATLNIVLLRAVSRARQDAVARLQADRGKFVASSFNALSLIETVKAAGAENDAFRRWAGFQAKVLNAEQKLGKPTALLTVLPPMLASLNSGFILLVGGLRATTGAISVGLLVAFQTLLTNFTRPVTQLTNLGQRVQEVTTDLTRLRDVERHPEDECFADSVAGQTDEHRLDGRLEMRRVSFGYSPLAPPLLTDFQLTLQPGRRVAIVGSSGSGKSTVGKLIAGLYQPKSGEILFDGRKRSEIPRWILSASVAFVDQDLFMFEGTVRENVTLWDHTLTDEVVVAALRDAEIYDEVASRPGSINSPVSEGGRNFSGGQRQRLEIARALATSPSLLVLDEATSALDVTTEKRIDDNLRRRGCACVIIAHRLSTIRDADEILVLDRGRLVQRGRHAELVAVQGPYADLISAS